MATVKGAKIVWTSADMAALQQDMQRLQELIDKIPTNPSVAIETDFQDPCPAFVRWTVAKSNDPQALKAPGNMQTLTKGTAPPKGKEPPKK